MPLLKIWSSAPEAVDQMSIEQIVANAGDGVLKDASTCSLELREYLTQIPSTKIETYVKHCLSLSFTRSGMVLQDLVNELGRRLEYAVTNGRYQGSRKEIGHDGLWESPESGHAIIAEVKTTDAYRISLDAIATYRSRLISEGRITQSSSILIIVGREDTGELEAQVRGSRHAWDIRLISADALVKLVRLKESTEGRETALKIRTLLAPMEYTRIDELIDVMFTTARDVEGTSAPLEADAQNDINEPATRLDENTSGPKLKGQWQFINTALLQEKRDQIVSAMSKKFQSILVKKSKALFWNASRDKRIACTVSKSYNSNQEPLYWYGYRSQWREFLLEGSSGSCVVFGCVDLASAFAVPATILETALDYLNITTVDGARMYWHIHIVERQGSHFFLQLPKKADMLALEEYRIPLT